MPSLKSRRYIRIWDAGCAMGAEPFSLAIVLRESMGPMIFRNVHILATDIDTMDQFGDMIHSGVYPERDVKRIPRDIFSGYFMPNCQPDHFQLVDEIRNRVTFQKHDLLTLQSPREDFGAILCKNVLWHLKQKERVDVIKMFYGALADNGYLVPDSSAPVSDNDRLVVLESLTTLLGQIDALLADPGATTQNVADLREQLEALSEQVPGL